MTHDAYIALGSNLGDRAASLRGALEALDADPRIELVAASAPIETDPVGPGDQGPYLNAAAHLRTPLGPAELLAIMLTIEQRFGRDRASEQRWGARTLDLDLLVFGDRVIDEDALCVPHPRMHERDFVLIPLAEIAPDVLIPLHEKTPRDMLGALRA